MRYKVNGKTVFAEHAALSASQPANWLVQWITYLPNRLTALDYGCGRLRYATHLANRVKSVTAVDSYAQLSRVMTIYGEKCTVIEYVGKHHKNINVVYAEDFNEQHRYDFALCVNVLSSVPGEEWRKRICDSIYDALSPGGVALFVNQHRNSYFKQYRYRDGAKRHFDGWLIPHDRGYWFYGLVHPKSLCDLLQKSCFNIHTSGCCGESGFALCTKGIANEWLDRMPDPRRVWRG
jgi:SAM-dependent methyltransferase